MTINDKSTNNVKKKTKRPRIKAKEQTILSVISLRISDEEKERIDEIMRLGKIKRYSDVMRMAIQMVQVPNNDKCGREGIF
jgi:hypothetical protein